MNPLDVSPQGGDAGLRRLVAKIDDMARELSDQRSTTGRLGAIYSRQGILVRDGGGITGEGGGLLDWSGRARFGAIRSSAYVLIDPEILGASWIGIHLHSQGDSPLGLATMKSNRDWWGDYEPGSLMLTSGSSDDEAYSISPAEMRLSPNIGAEMITWDSDYVRTARLGLGRGEGDLTGLTSRGTVVVGTHSTVPSLTMRHRLVLNDGDDSILSSANRLTLRGRGTWSVDDTPAHVDLILDYSSGNYMQCEAVYTRTQTASANVYVNSNGTLLRATSATKYKVNIEDADFGEGILGLKGKTWFDKRAAETLAEELETGEPLEGNDLRPIPGLLAEDVEEHLGPEFVEYGPDGEIEGVLYDRAWIPLIKIISDLRDEVATLKHRLDNDE